jgi:hypothetical protein
MKVRFQMGSKSPLAKSKREDVLGRLLAQEMVDAEDLALGECFVELSVERDRTLQVATERLLHDDPRTLHKGGRPERVDHRKRGARRNAQVMKSKDIVAQLLLG